MMDISTQHATAKRLFFASFALALFVGCGDSQLGQTIKSNNTNNLQILSNCYRLYATFNERSGPPDEQTFKEFLKTSDAIERNLELMGLSRDLVDDYFISDRDNEPFVVLYGNAVAPGSNDPLVLEQTGIDGTKAVALTAKIIEVTKEADYQELLNGKIPKAYLD